MKKFIKICAVLMAAVLMLSAFAGCSSKTSKKLVEYKNEALGISFQRPEVWKQMTSEDTGVAFLYEQEDTSFAIDMGAIDNGITLDVAGQNSEASLKGMYTGYKLIEKDSNITIGGLKAIKLVYTDKSVSKPIMYVRLLVINGECGYDFEASCDYDKYKEVSKDFNAVFESVKFNKTTPPSPVPTSQSTPETTSATSESTAE